MFGNHAFYSTPLDIRVHWFRVNQFAVYHKTPCWNLQQHYSDVIMCAMASQIPSLTIVYSIVYSGADQRRHQSSASLAFVRGIHRWPMNSPHRGPVTRKIFQFDDVIMECVYLPFSGSKWTIWCRCLSFHFNFYLDQHPPKYSTNQAPYTLPITSGQATLLGLVIAQRKSQDQRYPEVIKYCIHLDEWRWVPVLQMSPWYLMSVSSRSVNEFVHFVLQWPGEVYRLSVTVIVV